MRRISLAVAVVVSVLVTSATMHAAPSRPVHHSALAGMLKKLDRLGHVRGAPHRATHRESAQVGAEKETGVVHPHQSAQTLTLPSSAFSPAVINSQYTGTIDANTANGDWFRSNHSAGYETFGFVFGFYQRADLSTTTPVTSFRYQGTYTNSVANAQRLLADGISTSQQKYNTNGKAPQSCTKDASVLGCQSIIYTYVDNSNVNWTEEYVVLQYKQCAAEITGTVPTSSASTVASQVDTAMNNIYNAAIVGLDATCGTTGGNPTPVPTATPPPAQTDFSVVSVRFEKAGAKPDWSLKNAPVTQVKAGTKVQISIYVNVRSLGSSSVTLARAYQLKLGNKTIFSKSSSSDISDVDTYRYSFDKIKLSKAGNYTFTAAVQIGSKTDGDSSKLRALKQYTVKKVSFAFNSLQLSSGTIHAGQQATANVGFTVQNLKGHTTGFITRTVLAQINGQWKGVSTNSNSTVVLNGANHSTVSTQFNAPGSFRIQVTVTVGSSSQTKTVPVNVSR